MESWWTPKFCIVNCVLPLPFAVRRNDASGWCHHIVERGQRINFRMGFGRLPVIVWMAVVCCGEATVLASLDDISDVQHGVV